jgi:hypothetical protein
MPFLRIVIATWIVIACSALVSGEQGSRASASNRPKPPAQLTAAEAIKRYEGVYKTRFSNSTVQGEKFESEDILEIASYAEDKVYFRLHLEFYNAHLCGLYGIATYEHGAFVFRDPSEDLESACVLTIRLGQDNVALEDADGGCRSYYCGARGAFSGESFPSKSRRPIGYMKRLKASHEYSEAVDNFKKAAAPK